MDNWRRSRYGRQPGRKIYIPSGWTPPERRSRFHRRNILEVQPEADRSRPWFGRRTPEKYDRFRADEPVVRTRPYPPQEDEYIPRAQRRATDEPRTEVPSERRFEPSPERSAEPPPPYYPNPAYPVYPAAPPYLPVYPNPWVLYDRYGRPLSEAEMAEIEAREAYEDRYGRDFDRYTSVPSPPSDPDSE